MTTTTKAPRTLNVLAKAINKNLETAGKAFYSIAVCLKEADERIKKENSKLSDKSQATTVVKWANDEFSFGKAWTYKAIKMAKTFSDEEAEGVFELVPARILGELASMKFEKIEEVKQVVQEAKEAIEAAADDAEIEAAKKEAADEIKEIKAESDAEKQAAKEEKLKAETPTPASAQVDAGAEIAEAGVPWDEDDKPQAESSTLVAGTLSDQAKHDLEQANRIKRQAEELEALRKQLAEKDALIAQLEDKDRIIGELVAEVKQAKQEAEAAKAQGRKAPALIQFKSQAAHVVLGLTAEQAETKRTINSAARMLASVYNKEQSPEEYAIIADAKAALLEALK